MGDTEKGADAIPGPTGSARLLGRVVCEKSVKLLADDLGNNLVDELRRETQALEKSQFELSASCRRHVEGGGRG